MSVIIKKKQCKCGKHEGYIFSHGYTKECWYKIKPPKPLKKMTIKKVIPKPTGEKILFDMIWNTRPHICQVSGEPIKEYNVSCFAHILSKGAYPKFRLFDKNIMLVTPEIHNEYDNVDRSHEKFAKINELHDVLIKQYYAK